MNNTPTRSPLRMLALVCSITLAAAFVLLSAGAVLLPSSKSGRVIHYHDSDAESSAAAATQPGGQ